MKSKALWASLLGILLSGGLLVLAVGYLALVVYSGLVTGTPVVDVLVEVAVLALAGIAHPARPPLAVSVVGLPWAVVRNASLPRIERVASLAGRLEREHSPVGAVGLADLLAPPEPSADERAERALADLKGRYVDGEITEAEFERKVDRPVANESLDEARAAARGRRVTEEEEATGR